MATVGCFAPGRSDLVADYRRAVTFASKACHLRLEADTFFRLDVDTALKRSCSKGSHESMNAKDSAHWS